LGDAGGSPAAELPDEELPWHDPTLALDGGWSWSRGGDRSTV
jgi:hypothetical protein